MAADLNWILFPTDQIEVEVSRSKDDSIIVTVNLRREITIDYEVFFFINDKLHERYDGIKGKINCNYTLLGDVQVGRGRITARLGVGQVKGEISLPQKIPPLSTCK